jgi:hypothetical protein
MLNIKRRARPLGAAILLAAGFAVLATTAEAVPSISPAGAARMAREKGEALKTQEQAAPMPTAPRTEYMRKNDATAPC